MRPIKKYFFHIYIITQVFNLQCNKTNIEDVSYLSKKDTSFFFQINWNSNEYQINPYEFYPFFINDTLGLYYQLNSIDNVIFFAKKRMQDSIERYIYIFNDGGYISFSMNYRFYIYRECAKSPNCMHYFDSLPYLRKNDLWMLSYILKDTMNVIMFNNMIKVIGKLESSIYLDILFKTQIMPTYYGYFKPPYSVKEHETIFNKDGIYKIYFEIKDSNSLNSFLTLLEIKPYEKNPWIIEQKKFLKKYIEQEKENLKKRCNIYMYTVPDCKLFKFEIDTSSGIILKKEYVNLYYKWLHPFMFFQNLCRPKSDDEYYDFKKYNKYTIWDYRDYDERDYEDDHN